MINKDGTFEANNLKQKFYRMITKIDKLQSSPTFDTQDKCLLNTQYQDSRMNHFTIHNHYQIETILIMPIYEMCM